MSEKQLARELRRLEKEMLEYARNLEFEKAAAARDELFRIRQQQVFGISGSTMHSSGSKSRKGDIVNPRPFGYCSVQITGISSRCATLVSQMLASSTSGASWIAG
jgi:hypothetical protein